MATGILVMQLGGHDKTRWIAYQSDIAGTQGPAISCPFGKDYDEVVLEVVRAYGGMRHVRGVTCQIWVTLAGPHKYVMIRRPPPMWAPQHPEASDRTSIEPGQPQTGEGSSSPPRKGSK